MNDKWYSDFLHKHARKWGLQVPDNPPLITDKTSPYPQPAVIEELTWTGDPSYHYTAIKLLELNDQFSYTLTFQWQARGRSYKPLLKFCDPYPTKGAALEAAIEELKRTDPPSEMRTWIHDLTQPKQLSLF